MHNDIDIKIFFQDGCGLRDKEIKYTIKISRSDYKAMYFAMLKGFEKDGEIDYISQDILNRFYVQELLEE